MAASPRTGGNRNQPPSEKIIKGGVREEKQKQSGQTEEETDRRSTNRQNKHKQSGETGEKQ
jgi:hypothetical protein